MTRTLWGRIAYWAATLVVSLAAVVGLIALINSRDRSNLSPRAAAAGAPGAPYRGNPPLTPSGRAAVRLGNVVIVYRAARPPHGVGRLVHAGSPALVRAGQAVLLERDPALPTALAAVSRTRVQPADTPGQLVDFVDYWLGS
jgi:hypothetical protein